MLADMRIYFSTALKPFGISSAVPETGVQKRAGLSVWGGRNVMLFLGTFLK
jgi:hypothetical protein